VSGSPSRVCVEPATREDVPTIHRFICELAAYERAPEAVTGTLEMLDDALFGPQPCAEALLAVAHSGAAGDPDADAAAGPTSQPLGFALFHGTFSTWECRPGLWLEDLYVPERVRRGGVGGALLSGVAAIAVARGCARLEWTALDWNAPALAFYAGMGAHRLEQWTTHRLDGDALSEVARK
jgi:GNAT superfamily N-acetyltransferase